MIKKYFFSTILAILLTNCGFTVIKQNKINFNIVEILTEGNTRVNYYIKNKLLVSSQNKQKKQIKIKLNSVKNKTIREKNIKNEVTKYNIKLLINVRVDVVGTNKSTNFILTENGNYNVASMHSNTLINEKDLTKTLTNNVTEKLIEELSSKINDL
jgi:hypothetical protein